jgi:hypothetical protein
MFPKVTLTSDVVSYYRIWHGSPGQKPIVCFVYEAEVVVVSLRQHPVQLLTVVATSEDGGEFGRRECKAIEGFFGGHYGRALVGGLRSGC